MNEEKPIPPFILYFEPSNLPTEQPVPTPTLPNSKSLDEFFAAK